jgi:hypothetical protein
MGETANYQELDGEAVETKQLRYWDTWSFALGCEIYKNGVRG